jgi:hypothetical protein
VTVADRVRGRPGGRDRIGGTPARRGTEMARSGGGCPGPDDHAGRPVLVVHASSAGSKSAQAETIGRCLVRQGVGDRERNAVSRPAAIPAGQWSRYAADTPC